jgi:hypothetical protein
MKRARAGTYVFSDQTRGEPPQVFPSLNPCGMAAHTTVVCSPERYNWWKYGRPARYYPESGRSGAD